MFPRDAGGAGRLAREGWGLRAEFEAACNGGRTATTIRRGRADGGIACRWLEGNVVVLVDAFARGVAGEGGESVRIAEIVLLSLCGFRMGLLHFPQAKIVEVRQRGSDGVGVIVAAGEEKVVERGWI